MSQLPRRPDHAPPPTSRSAAAPRWSAARGDGHLEALTLADRDTGGTEEVPTSWLFVFIGASPRTDWLGDDVARDDHGFVLTGPDLLASDAASGWPLQRGRRTRWRRACPACSRPATSGSTR